MQAFSAGTIPIYWGNANVAMDFNEKAFINCHSYSNFDEVIEVVRQIDEDDTLFREYLLEPIGNEEQFPEYSLKEWRDFVIYICKQDPKAAMRRNNVFWGAKYQQRMKQLSKLEIIYKKMKKIYANIRKVFLRSW